MKRIHSLATLAVSVAATVLMVNFQTYAAAPPAPQGVITVFEFLDIPGTTLPDLTNNAKFPNSPDVEAYPPRFEWPTGPDDATLPPGNVKQNYGVQVIGYFYPPTTGQYRFAIAADDNAAVYLSTDSTPAKKVQIAIEAGWNPVRNWDGQANGRLLIDVGTADERWNNQSKPITLTANQPYYIEALMKEGGGGDNVAIAYRTDGSWPVAGDLPILGTELATINKNSGPVSIVTQPQSQTIQEGTPVTFSVVADGTPTYTYQWKKGGADITDATNRTYSIALVATTDAGPYTVAVTGAQGAPVTSNPATLTVSVDTTPPTITSVLGGSSVTAPLSGATVVFSERMDAVSAGTAGNYTISGGVTVSGATVLNDTTVALRTSTQTRNTPYTLTVSNVKDRAAAPNTIAPNSTAQFRSVELVPNIVKWEMWNGGIAIGTLTNNLADGDFGRPPNTTFLTARFESGRALGSDYGARGYTWFKAPVSGDYTFYMTVDDNARLYLSTDDNPANKKNIAAEATWSDNRTWTGAIGTEQASDSYLDTEWPSGNTITLTQNQLYYLEAQWQEGGGGDGVEVTYKLAADPDPVTGEISKLSGSVISLYSDTTGASVTISQQPASQTLNEGRKAALKVTATGSSAIVYQWQRAAAGSSTFTDIPGGSGPSYTTPNLAIADSGVKYRVVLSVLGAFTTSSEAIMTVVPDTFPPVVLGAGALKKGAAIEIGVGFDEPVDQASALLTANYSLSAGTVSGVRYQQYITAGDGPGSGEFGSPQNAVVLTTTGVTGPVTLTVRNVKDLKNNTIPAAGVTANVAAAVMTWVGVGGNEYVEAGDPATQWPDDAVSYNSDKDFDLISGGSGFWDGYDEATFVYEAITGDFDKKVRVEYQDPSSQWARCGLMVREALDEGVTRAQIFDQPDGAVNPNGIKMSQDFTTRVNPAIGHIIDPGDPSVRSPANNSYEVIHRPRAGFRYGGTAEGVDAAFNIASGFGGAPAYPSAWIRIKREGQKITTWRSDDGVTWTGGANVTYTNLSTTVEDESLAATLFVGPFYGPEMVNNNARTEVGHSVHAKFRDYGNVATVGGAPLITFTTSGNNLIVTWTPATGALESSPVLPGTSWTPIAGTSPVTVPIGTANQFIRVKQ